MPTFREVKHELGTVLKWLGRLLLVAAAFVLVASLFAPQAVQALNGVACPSGFELDNVRLPTTATRTDAPLEPSCVSPDVAVDATREVALIVVGLAVTGLGLAYLRQRLLRPQYRRPDVHSHAS